MTKPTPPPAPTNCKRMSNAKRQAARNALRRISMWENHGWLTHKVPSQPSQFGMVDAEFEVPKSARNMWA